MTDEQLRDTVDYVAITRLLGAYADVVNRRAWPEFAHQFLPDAPVTVDTVTNPVVELAGPEQVGAFIGGAVERFEFFEFVILNTHLDLRVDGDPNRAHGRVFICELRQEASNGHASQSYGVYRDDYRRVDGRWLFARRRYRSLARTGRGEVFAFPSDESARD
jgi:hypothetical protein